MSEREIFIAALQEDDPGRRQAYLEEACAGRPDLRKQVEGLLRLHEGAGSFLEKPAPDVPPTGVCQDATEQGSLGEVPGAVIGPYKLMEPVGEGGMGSVWMAQQTEPVKRLVAVKLIKAGMDSKQVIARFEAERQALALMDHPNIARVLDAGATATGRPYFVMDLVRGVPITKYCDEHHLTPRQRLELFIPVCQAVQHAHQKGIIHRDIKPSNVLVALYDGKPVPKVIDFGVAKAAGQRLTDKTLVTGFGAIVGTLEYMSPEQAEINQLDIDTRSDIYSLGVLLYELLTGTPPFTRKELEKGGMLEMLRVIREEEPSKPSTKLSTAEGLPTLAANRGTEPAKLTRLVRGELDWIVMKALEKDRNRRYETANGFAMDVQRYLNDEPVQACPPSVGYRLRKFARRNKRVLATGGVIAFALVLGTAISIWQAIRATQAEALAEDRLETANANYRMAEEQRLAARTQEGIAREQESLARRRFYASQITLAYQAWEAGNPARVLELLEGLRPKFDEPDLRTFEWFYLWRLCHPGRQLNWRGDEGQINAVAFSPDGRTLASGGMHGNVKLWDVATGAERAAFKQVAAKCLAFSPDGATLCVGSWRHWETSLKLWDVATGRELAPLPGDLPSVFSVAFSHDGKTIGAGTHTGKVFLWDLATRQLKRTLAAHTAPAMIGFAPDDSLLVTATWYGDRRTKIWNLAVEPPGVVFDEAGAQCVAFSSDGRTVAAGANLWDVPTGKRKATLQGHRGGVGTVAFSPDGQTVATAGLDRMVRLWDVRAPVPGSGKLRASQAHGAMVHCVAFAPDGKTLATASGDGILTLWDMATTPNPSVLQHTAAVHSIAFSPDGMSLVATGDFPARVWDVASGQERATFAVTGAGALSPDRQTFACRGPDNTVKVCDPKTGVERATFRGQTREVRSFAFSPDSRMLAAGGENDTVLWDLSTQKLQATLSPAQVAAVHGGTVSSVAFSPDGKTLATGTQFNRVRLWDIARGREGVVLQDHLDSSVRAIVFSPDGKALAAGNDRGTVRLWEVGTGRQLPGFFQGHTDAILALAFSPDGLTLATGSDDSTARLWDVITGQERLTLSGHRGGVRAIAFAPDGKTLATGSTDGAVRLWRATNDPMAVAFKEELDPKDADSPRADNEHADRLRDAGRTGEAEQAYRRAMPRLEKLIRAFPDEPAYAQELAASHLGLSFVLHIGGFSEEARQAHDRAMSLYDQVTARFPNASDPRGVLAFGYYDLGMKLGKMKQPAEAGLAFRQAAELYEKLVVDRPTNASYHVMLADVTYRLSLAGAEAGRPGEAEGWLGRTFPPSEWLANRFPSSSYRTSPVANCRAVAAVLKARGHLAAAEHALHQGLRLSGKLLDQSPQTESYQRLVAQCWFDLAGILAAGGKSAEAANAYWKIVELTKASALSPSYLGDTLRQQGNVDEAVAACREAIRLEPGSADGHATLGVILRDGKRDHEAAVVSLGKAIELAPNQASYHYHQGYALALRKEHDEAIASYQQAIELDPNNPSAYILLGNSLGHLREPKKLDRAIVWLRKVIEPGPLVPDAYFTLGTALLRQNKADEAIAVYRQGLERLPNAERLHVDLAGVLRGQRRLEEAAAGYRQAVKLNPRAIGYHIALGRLLNQQKKPREAEDAYRKAIDLNPQRADAHYELGQTLAALGKDTDAIASYRQAVQVDPKYLPAYISLGNALQARKDLDGVIAAYRRALEALGPNHTEAPNIQGRLASAYQLKGNLPEAIRLYEQVRDQRLERFGPNHAATLASMNDLAMAYDQDRQFARAESLLREALERAREEFGAADPRTAGPLATLGRNLLQQRKYADAEPLLRDCLALRDKAEPDAWTTFNARSMLGGCLLGQKKYAEAEPLLLEGYEGMKEREARIPPLGKPRLPEAIERLVQLYDDWGKPEQAARWRKKLDEK